MGNKGIDVSHVKSIFESMMEEGKTVVAVSIDNNIIGLIGLMDTPRSEADLTLKISEEYEVEDRYINWR